MSKQEFRTRERKDGKTTYGHAEFVIRNATIATLKHLLGNQYDNAHKVLKKGIRKGVFE